MEKWIFYVLVFVYMCYRAVYGIQPDKSITVDQINYEDVGFLEVGTRKTINCKGSARNQKLEWVDPSGNVIKRMPSNRVFAQEHFVSNPKIVRNSALGLTISKLLVTDSGLYQCKSGDQKKTVPICVIKPSEFVDTPAEITIEAGRSITLTCQANGDPEPILVWNRDGNDLAEGDVSPKYKVNRKFNRQGYEKLLTIISLEPEDGGLYKCVSVQKSPKLDNCTHYDSFNVTLYVNHVPQFKNENDTKLVYGKVNGGDVDLKCAASGWPKPTYRWFKVLDGDTLYEFDKTAIKFIEEPNMAILSVTAGPTTFDNFYKCVASNTFGDSEKIFQLVKSKLPGKANVEEHYVSETGIFFNLTWLNPITFPINSFDVQYIEASRIGSRKLKDNDWINAHQERIEFDQDEYDDDDDIGIAVYLHNLKPETEYIVRLRASNDVGKAPWSTPVRVKTLNEPVTEENESTEIKPKDEETKDSPLEATPVDSDKGTVFGIFFAGAILIVAVVCMFAMRIV